MQVSFVHLQVSFLGDDRSTNNDANSNRILRRHRNAIEMEVIETNQNIGWIHWLVHDVSIQPVYNCAETQRNDADSFLQHNNNNNYDYNYNKNSIY